MNEDQIKRMVDRFLGWKLPENFNPDGGISFERVRNKNTPWPRKNEPTGTNLLDADQAEAMVRYIVAEPSPEPEAAPASETQAPAACGALHTTTEGDVYACVRDSGHEDYHSSVRDSIRIAKGGVFWWDRTSRTQAPAVTERDYSEQAQGPHMSSQTQNNISDERLAEIVNIYAQLSTSQKESGGVYWPDAVSMAHELTALRASHKRLAEALQSCMNNLNMTRLIMPADARTQTAELLAEYRAALAEARKLEGK